MLKLQSKTGTTKGNQELVFNYLSDFRNFEHLLPKERLRNIRINEGTCYFDIDGLGPVGLKISHKLPCSQLCIKGTEKGPVDFTLMVNLKSLSDNLTQVNIGMEASMNLFLEMMAKNPLQQFIDMLVDKMGEVEFGQGTVSSEK
jgi:hypothetical protein